MKAVIIEDEKLAADNLELMLKSLDEEIEICAKIESVRNAVKWLSSNHCDLIFLDIQLSDGISFNIFEQCEVKSPVIFITAFDQYAIRAFKHLSVDYLLKPVNKEDLQKSLQKYRTLFNNNQTIDFKKLLNELRNPATYQERFLVYAGQKIRTIKTNEVAYFYVQQKGVFLCSIEGKNYDLNYTLDKLEEILDPKIFFRVNRQYIINIEAIENMYVVSKSRYKLDIKPKPSEDVIVSVNHIQEFRDWLNR